MAKRSGQASRLITFRERWGDSSSGIRRRFRSRHRRRLEGRTDVNSRQMRRRMEVTLPVHGEERTSVAIWNVSRDPSPVELREFRLSNYRPSLGSTDRYLDVCERTKTYLLITDRQTINNFDPDSRPSLLLILRYL